MAWRRLRRLLLPPLALGGIARVSLGAASRSALPFIGALIAVVVLLIFFPRLATWLPALAKG
jgi:C4-dicarboxylate transporter DctM subunit